MTLMAVPGSLEGSPSPDLIPTVRSTSKEYLP